MRASISMSPFVENLPEDDRRAVRRAARNVDVRRGQAGLVMSLHDPDAVRRSTRVSTTSAPGRRSMTTSRARTRTTCSGARCSSGSPASSSRSAEARGSWPSGCRTSSAPGCRTSTVSPRMVELARARGVDGRGRRRAGLPFADGTFDTVVAAWMLYHVPGPRPRAGRDRPCAPAGRRTDRRHELGIASRGASCAGLAIHPGSKSGSTARTEPSSCARILRRWRSTISTITVTVHDRSKLVAYQQSMSMPTQPVPDAVEIPFVTHSRPTIFFATR